jgi:RNA polymerase sigma factor (TIGR02999 family)
MDGARAPVTLLLERSQRGDEGARSELFARLEAELRRLAHAQMRREQPGHVLQTTALVNEAWLRIAANEVGATADRAHFLAIAAQAMRHVLVDEARRRRALKRGGGIEPVDGEHVLDLLALESLETSYADAEVLHVALERLEAMPEHRAKAQVVELRWFGGLSVEEAARALELSPATVKRHFEFARAWLRREIGRMLERE